MATTKPLTRQVSRKEVVFTPEEADQYRLALQRVVGSVHIWGLQLTIDELIRKLTPQVSEESPESEWDLE